MAVWFRTRISQVRVLANLYISCMYNEMSYTTSITWTLTSPTRNGIRFIKKIYYDCELKQRFDRDSLSLPRTLSKLFLIKLTDLLYTTSELK